MTPEQVIVPALGRESRPWPDPAAEGLETAVLEAAAHHGVSALLSATPAVRCWPDPVRSALATACRHAAAIEAVRREELTSVLAELARAGIRTLVLKGAQLAYTHYPSPWLRPRLDTDLLVASNDRGRAGEILRTLGYRPGTHFNGDLVTHQFRYERNNRYGFTDVVDLHWRIANPHAFAGMLTFDELDERAQPIGMLGDAGRGLSDAHALVLACIHRVAHHDNSDRLIWLYDIHLLASAMTAEAQEAVAELARTKRLRSVCASGITRAQARFGTSIPHNWGNLLASDRAEREPTATFLRTGTSKIDLLLSDLQTLEGWQPRLKLVREHLFPPVAYIRHTYGANPVLIPFGYVHRIVAGVGKWFHRGRES